MSGMTGSTIFWLFLFLCCIFTCLSRKKNKPHYFTCPLDRGNVVCDYNVTSISGVVLNSAPNKVYSLPEKAQFLNGTLPRRHVVAYSLLLHGISSSLSYRPFLLGCLVIHKALRDRSSQSDMVVFVGFENDTVPSNMDVIVEDLRVLHDAGIRLKLVPSFSPAVGAKDDVFTQITLSKIMAWSLTEYRRVQFMDADMYPVSDMDCNFRMAGEAIFEGGLASPINAGWAVLTPNRDDFNAMRAMAEWRLRVPWQSKGGYGTFDDKNLHDRFHGIVLLWEFHGASLEQGLFVEYFVMYKHEVSLLEWGFETTDIAEIRHAENRTLLKLSAKELIGDACHNDGPKHVQNLGYEHFLGDLKPWLKQKKESAEYLMWLKTLDSMHLRLNSSNLYDDFHGWDFRRNQ